MSAGERNEPRRTMTDAQARWVREHAWTPAMRKTYATTPALYSTCPCQHGPCGHCTAGHHDQCPYTDPSHTQWAATKADTPIGHITDTSDTVPTLNGTNSWQIWETGTTHDARCPCALAGHHDRTPPPQTKTNPTSTENATQTTIFDFL